MSLIKNIAVTVLTVSAVTALIFRVPAIRKVVTGS
jgi:hypothetical protein